MKLSMRIKSLRMTPIRNLKANTAQLETLALLKILALGKTQVAKGEFVGVDEAQRNLAPR